MTEYASEKPNQFQRIPDVSGNYTYQELSDIVNKFLETYVEDKDWPVYEAWVLKHMNKTDGVYIDEFNWWLT